MSACLFTLLFALLAKIWLVFLISLLQWPVFILDECTLPFVLTLVALLNTGVFTSVMRSFYLNMIIARVGVARASVIYNCISFFVAIETALPLHKSLSVSHNMGGALILGGAYTALLGPCLITRRGSKPENESPDYFFIRVLLVIALQPSWELEKIDVAIPL